MVFMLPMSIFFESFKMVFCPFIAMPGMTGMLSNSSCLQRLGVIYPGGISEQLILSLSFGRYFEDYLYSNALYSLEAVPTMHMVVTASKDNSSKILLHSIAGSLAEGMDICKCSSGRLATTWFVIIAEIIGDCLTTSAFLPNGSPLDARIQLESLIPALAVMLRRPKASKMAKSEQEYPRLESHACCTNTPLYPTMTRTTTSDVISIITTAQRVPHVKTHVTQDIPFTVSKYTSPLSQEKFNPASALLSI